MSETQQAGHSILQKAAKGFVAVAMMFSMAVATPAIAFAAEGSHDAAVTDVAEDNFIDILHNPIQVKASSQVSLLGTDEDPNFRFTEGDHLEFKVLSGNAGSVNRRGMFSAQASGTSTVGVYLHEGKDPEPAPEPGKPVDPADGALVSTTVTVTVVAHDPSDTYTFQGNDQAILMTNPLVQSFVKTSDGYVNQLGKVSSNDGYITFDITMQAGFGNNIKSWLQNNAKNIIISSSATQKTFDANSGYIEVKAASSSTRTEIVVTVDALSLLDEGFTTGSNWTLTFASSFSGNNPDRTLGVPVEFDFTV